MVRQDGGRLLWGWGGIKVVRGSGGQVVRGGGGGQVVSRGGGGEARWWTVVGTGGEG